MAGYEVGNGGGGIACDNHTSVQLADYSELVTPAQVHLQYASATTWPKKVADLLNRIQSKNPARVALYLNWLNQFLNEARFLQDSHLNPSADVGLVPIPNGCKYVQIAGQIEPDVSMPYRYIIDQNLWDRMDENSKAGLVLHELIWREVRHQTEPHKDGRFVREFTAWLTSAEIADMTLSDYITLLMRLHLETAQVQFGIKIRLSEPPVFISSSQVRRAAVVSQAISLPFLQSERASTESVQVYLSSKEGFEFLDDGTPAEFDIIGLNSTVYGYQTPLSLTILKGAFIVVVGVESKFNSVLHVQNTDMNGDHYVTFTPKTLFTNSNEPPLFTSMVMTPNTSEPESSEMKRQDCFRYVQINITRAQLLKCDEF